MTTDNLETAARIYAKAEETQATGKVLFENDAGEVADTMGLILGCTAAILSLRSDIYLSMHHREQMTDHICAKLDILIKHL